MASRLASILVLVIVAATLIAGLIAGAQNESNGPVDLIVLNGRVYTGDNSDVEEALAVRGNQILKVGSNREIRRLTRAQTTVIDARGGTVVPGFVDTQVNLIEAGRASDRLDLDGLLTVADIDQAVARYAASHPDRAWIEGRGWDATLYEKLPTRQALDAIVPHRPAYLVSADSTVMWANSKALEAAGITRLRAKAGDGMIVTDKRTGEPTGILRDAAQQVVVDAMPALSSDERQHAIEQAIVLAHRAGVTSVHGTPVNGEDLQTMARLRRSGEMPLRVYQLLQGSIDMSPEAATILKDVRRQYPEVPLFKIGAMRIDIPAGSTESDRGAMVESLASRVIGLHKEGWQVAIRVDDLADIDVAALAFERIPATDLKARRHRIEVRERVDDAMVARLARRGVTVSIVPSRTLDPLGLLADAAENTSPKSYPHVLTEALDRLTSVAAQGSLDDHRKGTLAAGMLADLVVLSADLFATPPSELRGVKVNVTVFDGKVVYDRHAAPLTTH